MDALPIVEKTSLPYASTQRAEYNGQEVGVMHACGHDTHVAMLMSVAEVLSGVKINWPEPSNSFSTRRRRSAGREEGGAPLMIKGRRDGRSQSGCDLWSAYRSRYRGRTYSIQTGSLHGLLRLVSYCRKGKGSHGSQPWLGVDPVVVSAQIIEGLQTIVSRQSVITHARW